MVVVVLVVCLLGAAGWFWNQAGKDRVIPRSWAAVEEGRVYRSGQLSSALVRDMLARHQIKVIVALTVEWPRDKDQQAERKAAEELGIELLRFPLNDDGTGEVQQYIEAVTAIVEAKRQTKPVLVHGVAGVRRTGGVIACYRLLVEGRTPAYVLDEMRRCGWKPKDTQLLAYLNQNLGTIAALLHDRAIIAAVPDPLPVLPAPK
jgi:protein tyrosine/serine phosphatase